MKGKSYSNVLQIEVSAQLLERLDLLAAWRWNDVKMTIDGSLRRNLLQADIKAWSLHRILSRLRKWQYDLHPADSTDQAEYHQRVQILKNIKEPIHFDTYTVVNAQITRNFKKWQIYAGAENLFDFSQHMPLIAADDPFGEYFDSSLIWGPVHGRKIYGGFRFFLNRNTN